MHEQRKNELKGMTGMMDNIDLDCVIEQVRSANSASEVQAIIENNGFIWNDVKDQIMVTIPDDELTADELKAVSGGGFNLWGTLGKLIATDFLKDILKGIIDKKSVESTNCVYSKDGNTRTCTTKTIFR